MSIYPTLQRPIVYNLLPPFANVMRWLPCIPSAFTRRLVLLPTLSPPPPLLSAFVCTGTDDYTVFPTLVIDTTTAVTTLPLLVRRARRCTKPLIVTRLDQYTVLLTTKIIISCIALYTIDDS